MKIREHGIQARERGRIYSSKPTCASGQNFGSVRLIDCYASLLILGCGFIISAIIYCIETVVNSKLTKILLKNVILKCKEIRRDEQ